MITNEWKSWRQYHIDYSALFNTKRAKWALLISTIFGNTNNFFYEWISEWIQRVDDDDEHCRDLYG